jgi:hypothetical protein
VLFFISTATTSSGAYPALDQPAGDLSDALVEGCVGNILAAVFQHTAVWRSPSMKGDEAGKIDYFVARLARFLRPRFLFR